MMRKCSIKSGQKITFRRKSILKISKAYKISLVKLRTKTKNRRKKEVSQREELFNLNKSLGFGMLRQKLTKVKQVS